MGAAGAGRGVAGTGGRDAGAHAARRGAAGRRARGVGRAGARCGGGARRRGVARLRALRRVRLRHAERAPVRRLRRSSAPGVVPAGRRTRRVAAST
ncbi:hypothetical protein C5C46_06335 [Rathayibacter sp. AY1E6]|nr:hypothetical protein C5C46_06335 [Rathayibacter sp. AY1E6]